jgi:hypothetical protein
MKCPECPVNASTSHHLKKHLMGSKKRGGHEISEMQAEAIAEDVFAGTFRKPVVVTRPPNSVVVVSGKSAQPDAYSSFLTDLFSSLVINKRLPKYQFERRVDAIIAMFLPGIFKAWRDWDVEMVVPEFPLKKAANNQSTNTDSLWFRHGNKSKTTDAWIFFELKTDSASCNDEQLSIYRSAMDKGMPQLLNDLAAITAASSSRPKYEALRQRLAHLPVDCPIELVYLSPGRIDCEDPRVLPLTFLDLEKMSLATYPLAWDLFRSIVLPHIQE